MTRFLRLRGKTLPGYAQPSIKHSVVSLGYTAINGIIGVFLLFYLRDAIMSYVDLSDVYVRSIRFIEMSVGIILSTTWLVFIIIVQHLYEKDFMHSWIPRRFIIYTVLQFVLIGATQWYINSVI